MRMRSIVVATAGGDELGTLLETEADAVLITMIDPEQSAASQRERAREAIARVGHAGKVALVAVNHPRTRLLREDLETVVMDELAAVALPHATEPQDVRDLAVSLREFELARGIEPGASGAIPLISSAAGLLRAADIAACSPRVVALAFDTPGYAWDTGARDEEDGPRLAFARGAIVAAARAVDALPLVLTGGYEVQQLSHYGFAGAVLLEPRVVPAANQAFTPSDRLVAAARSIRAAYAGRNEGEWVARVGQRMVDVHADKKAAQVLEQAGEN